MSTFILQLHTDTSYSYVVVVKTGEKTYDYTACLKCSEDEYATDTSGEENDYCNSAWLTNDFISYGYSYDAETLYVYYGTKEEEIKEQVGLTYDTVKKDNKGNTLATVSGDDDVVYPQNINELVGKNVNSIVTLKYTLPNGTELTKNALIYKHNAPRITMTYTNGNSTTGKSAGDTYTSGDWSNGVNVTISFSDSDIEEIFTNGEIKIGKVEYYDSSTSSWKDTGCTVSTSGTSCSWIVESSFNKTVKFRITNNNGFVSDESSEVTIRVDVTDPSCELTTSGTLGSNNWYTSNVTITLTKNDTGGSGIASYGMGTSKTANYNSKSSVNYTSNTSGITYYGYVRDGAGNTNTCNTTFKKDSSTPSTPSVTFTKWSDNNGTKPTKSSTTNKGSTITISTTSTTWSNYKIYSEPSGGDDTTSGVDHYEYTTTGATTNETDATGSYRNIIVQGESTIKYRACNEAGVCSAYTSAYKVGVDYTAPTCTVVAESTLKSTSINPVLNCSDTYSGISAYYWGTTSGSTPSTTITSDINSLTSTSGLTKTVSSSNPGTYYLYGKDVAGNVSSGTNQTYYSYNVYNMLQKTSGTAGNYNTTNYEQKSSGTYIAVQGTTLTSSSVYTKPITYSTYEGYSTSNSTSSLTSSSASLTSNGASLYYWFARNTYTITYTLNNGTNNSSNPSSYTYGVGVSSFANPTRTGYTFNGWYSESSFTNKVTSISTTSTGNKTLYAKWTANTYTITYTLNNGTNNSSNPSSYTYGVGVSSFANPTRTGYTFGGWYSDSSLTTKVTSISTTATGSKTLYAKWTIATYTIEFVDTTIVPGFSTYYSSCNGTKTTATYNSTWSLCDAVNKLTTAGSSIDPAPVFKGWYTGQNGTGTEITSSTKATSNLTVYAYWTQDTKGYRIHSGIDSLPSSTVSYNGTNMLFYVSYCYEASGELKIGNYTSGKWCMVYPTKSAWTSNTISTYSSSTKKGLLPGATYNNFVLGSQSFRSGVSHTSTSGDYSNNFYIIVKYYYSISSTSSLATRYAYFSTDYYNLGTPSETKSAIFNAESISGCTSGKWYSYASGKWLTVGYNSVEDLVGSTNYNNLTNYYKNSTASSSSSGTPLTIELYCVN